LNDSSRERAFAKEQEEPQLLVEVENDSIRPLEWSEAKQPLDDGRVCAVTTRQNPVGRALKDVELLRFLGDFGNELHCAGRVADHPDPEPREVHDSIESFEAGLKANDDNISPSQIYVYAALQSNVPFANGAPNLSTDLPCMIELAHRNGVPIAGRDFKTGQTLMKTLIAPGLKARMLGLRGWYSTNILGNRDGEVLDAPENFKTKEESKLGVLHKILEPEVYPDLYGNIDHVVRINYYPPRGDNKEGWDAIDIFGWMGYPMQIKIDFLCRDSILAAPIVLDLALFMDLAHRAGESGVQEWLSFYLKAPQSAIDGVPAEQDLFIQQSKLKNTLREWMGEQAVTHSEAG
jgi:myo-inositol-1-phosphate synthase